MLRVKNLRVGYGTLEVVKGISFHVSPGEIVALIGANGAGKTSLLKSVVGLVPLWSGQVFIGGRDIANGFSGVANSYAIQAGRELRVIVESEKISDEAAVLLSRDVVKRIEEALTFPGQIKVTVIRETRAVEYANK